MDAFEIARRRQAKNLERRQRHEAKATEQKEETEAAQEVIVPSAWVEEKSIPLPESKLSDGEILVKLCFSGRQHEYKFHCSSLTGSVMPNQVQQMLLEALTAKFGTRVKWL